MLPEIMSANYSWPGVSGSALPSTSDASSPTLYRMEVDRRSGPEKFEIRVTTITPPPPIHLAISLALSSRHGRSTKPAASWRSRGGGQRRRTRRRARAKSNGCGTCHKVPRPAVLWRDSCWAKDGGIDDGKMPPCRCRHSPHDSAPACGRRGRRGPGRSFGCRCCTAAAAAKLVVRLDLLLLLQLLLPVLPLLPLLLNQPAWSSKTVGQIKARSGG